MDKTKLIRQLKKFEAYMMVDKGLGDVTVGGYYRPPLPLYVCFQNEETREGGILF